VSSTLPLYPGSSIRTDYVARRTVSTAESPPENIRAGDAALREYFRYPAGMIDVRLDSGTKKVGFFRLGSAKCFGGSTLESVKETIRHADEALPDAMSGCVVDSGTVHLTFDPGDIAANLRLERYVHALARDRKEFLNSARIRQAYYLGRRFLPVRVRKHLQRVRLREWRRLPFPAWPVDCSVDRMFEQVLHLAIQARSGDPVPFVWFWPDGHAGCMILTHDVEEASGRDYCPKLMELSEGVGLRSAFQIIPEGRYEIPPSLLNQIRSRGHEINIHDLNHDGHLFREREEFLRRAAKISAYARQYGAEGFRSGVLYRNLEWYEALDFAYDMSVPNVAHLDPQRGGCCTVMPYFVNPMLELPLTTTQDYSLFHILNDYSLSLWESQIELILERHGLISFNIHPDYLIEERERALYVRLLSKLASVRDDRDVWATLPHDVNLWWRQRSQMELVQKDGTWQIVGEGSERACVAYASVNDDCVVYNR